MTDEEEVQKDIEQAGNGDENHGGSGISHAPEKAADGVIHNDEGNACKADGKVGPRILQCFCRRLQGREDEGHEEKEDEGKEEGKGDEKEGGASHEAEGFFIFPGSQAPGDGYGASNGEACDDDDDHVHDLAADGYPGDRGGAIVLAGNEKVRHAVEGLEEAGCQVGEGKPHHFREKGAAG